MSIPWGLEFIDQGETLSPIIGGASAGFYGFTISKLELVGISFTKVNGGVQAHVKDFNCITKSYITQRADVYENGQRIVFNREQRNIQQTSKHEGDHRVKQRQEYNRIHDQVLKDLNSNQVYKDPNAAANALKEKLSNAFRDFNYRDTNHLEPVWHNSKPAQLERPPDTKAQEHASDLVHSRTDPSAP